MNEDEPVVERRIHKPSWLESLLEKTFFEPCTTHPFRKNELHKYCITCDAPVCQYCVFSTTHRNHLTLKIYRHVYKDVVSLTTMDNYIDSSLIQPYKCNKQLVISLHPLPHCGSSTNAEISCETCSRRLTEPDLYRYCSLACKVTGVLTKEDEADPPFISLPSPPPSPTPSPPPEPEPEPEEEEEEENAEAEKPFKRRKGTPQRSPFF